MDRYVHCLVSCNDGTINRVLLYGGTYSQRQMTDGQPCIKACVDDGVYAEVVWLPVFTEWFDEGQEDEASQG